MQKVNIQTLKENFPYFLKKLSSGNSLALCYRNVQVALINPIKKNKRTRDPFGKYKKLVSFDYEHFDTDSSLVEDFYKSEIVHSPQGKRAKSRKS